MTEYKNQTKRVKKKYVRKTLNLKTLNTPLNTAIIASDFFLLNQDLRQQVGTLARNYTTLDPIALCKELKQFIRLIFFLRKNCPNESFVSLYCRDKRKLRILNTFIARNTGKFRISVRAQKAPRNISHPIKTPNAALFFNGISNSLLARFSERYRNLLSTVICYNPARISTYTIRNKMDSLKKTVFLMAFLESLLKKK
jgi:hypothetical protein